MFRYCLISSMYSESHIELNMSIQNTCAVTYSYLYIWYPKDSSVALSFKISKIIKATNLQNTPFGSVFKFLLHLVYKF